MGYLFKTKDFVQEEALNYQPGQQVELKSHPGVVDIIAEYDPMMVPPIWLANDPKPRYPHELSLLPKSAIGSSWLGGGRHRELNSSLSQTRSNLTTSSRRRPEVPQHSGLFSR